MYNINETISTSFEYSMSLKEIAISKIRTNPYQPRKFFSEDAIRELAGSIAAVGLLQPITVRQIGELYELIAGERRMRACIKQSTVVWIFVSSYLYFLF